MSGTKLLFVSRPAPDSHISPFAELSWVLFSYRFVVQCHARYCSYIHSSRAFHQLLTVLFYFDYSLNTILIHIHYFRDFFFSTVHFRSTFTRNVAEEFHFSSLNLNVCRHPGSRHVYSYTTVQREWQVGVATTAGKHRSCNFPCIASRSQSMALNTGCKWRAVYRL